MSGRRKWTWEKGEVYEPNIEDGWGGNEWSGHVEEGEYELSVFISERTGHHGEYYWSGGASGPQSEDYLDATGHTDSLETGKALAEDWARRIHQWLREIPVAEEDAE